MAIDAGILWHVHNDRDAGHAIAPDVRGNVTDEGALFLLRMGTPLIET